jgi:hypothetical protein
VHTCNDEGSGIVDGASSNCSDQGDQYTCINKACGCAAACDGKECGPDGCDGLCGECPENEFCDEDGVKFGEGDGLCFPTECTPLSFACGIADPTKLYVCDSDGFVADDVAHLFDCTTQGGGLCKLSFDDDDLIAEICNCDQPGQMECNYEETDENDNPISVMICLEDGSWKFEACTGGSSNPLCLAGKCMELCAENNNPCLGDVCSEAKEGEVHCAGGPGSFEGATLVCELGDSGTWLWMADSCPDGWTCAWDNNQCQEQGGGGWCGGAFCLADEICYGDYGQDGDTQDTCHDCGYVCDYLCGDVYGNLGIGSCACVDGQDGSPCDGGISCTNNQCSGAGGAACSSDQSVCAGNPCSAEDDGAKYCAYGPGTNASTYINCDYAEEGWKWVVAWCPDGQGCDTVTNQCKEDSNPGQLCATGGSPCNDQSCEVEGQTLCLDQGKILLCQHIGGPNYEWNVLDGCPSGATCTNDSCGSPGGDVVCLEGLANEEQAVSFCGQIKCCEGPEWECAEPASVCATNNDHTILHCNAEFSKPYSEICPLNSVCEGGECMETGGGGPICLQDNTCEGDPCTEAEAESGATGCPQGLGLDSDLILVCDFSIGSYQWVMSWCPEGHVCSAASDSCVAADPTDSCTPTEDACAGWSCGPTDAVKCLDSGAILLCESGMGGPTWKKKSGCPSGAACVNDDCSGGGVEPDACLETPISATAFCGSNKCCAGDTCSGSDAICATNNDHTVLHCLGQGQLVETETCPMGKICENGECYWPAGACQACQNPSENTWACIDNQCTDCDLVCSQAGVCGAVVGMNEWGVCNCADICPDGQECDYSQNACQDAEGCDPVNCGDQTCGATSNLCGEMAFCGAMCGFGQCGDDEAADVIVAGNDHIYVVGHSCHYGSVDGCWLTVWTLGPGGVPSGSLSVDSYSDWPLGYSDTRATAAALWSGDLYVVGWTRMPNDGEKKRYGFIARFDMSGPDPVLKQIHREETEPVVFLDIAMHPSWLGGDAIVVGHSEEYGMGYPLSRHPWAMRYRFPDPSTIEQAPTWNGTSNFGAYAANGIGDTIAGEGMATGVSIITPSSALIVGWLPVDPTINGNSIDPFLVHMNLSNGNFTAGVNLSSLHDTKVFGLRLLQSETLGGAYTAFVMGQRVVESKEYPWMAEISFSLEGVQALPTFNASSDYPQEKLWDMYAGGGALFDACLHPNGHWVLVGQAGKVDTSDVVPFVATVEKGGDDGSIMGAAQLFEQTALEDFSSLTDDAFQACATTTVAGIPRVIMVGDIQEKGSESGQDDILMVDYYPGLDGPATMQLPCAGMPLQP